MNVTIKEPVKRQNKLPPALLSPCHLCGRSKCFPSTQSNVAASSSPSPSAVSWATRPSVASPWTWRSVGSPGRGFLLQVSHSWTVLQNTTTVWSVSVINTSTKVLCCSKSCETLPKHLGCSRLQRSTSSFFYISMHQPIKVEVTAHCCLFLSLTYTASDCVEKKWSALTSFL